MDLGFEMDLNIKNTTRYKLDTSDYSLQNTPHNKSSPSTTNMIYLETETSHDDLQNESQLKQQKLQIHFLMYAIPILFFLIFYILLFIPSTKEMAQYLVLTMSLLLSLLYAIKPTSIYIPLKIINIRFPVDKSTIPIICVLLLIISQNESFTIHSALNAIKGDEIKPWSVLGVLFGLCYLCITLDLTGILKGLAIKTVDLAGSNQRKLFLYIFLFASVLTVITNNDISIICLTPLVCSMTVFDVTPYIFMVLFASNTFSMVLVTGNPANLMVQQAARLSYIEYSKYMMIPAIIAGGILYAQLYLMFRKKLKETNETESETRDDWRNSVKFPWYAIFCGLRLISACIGVLIVDQLQTDDANTKYYPLDMFVVLGMAILAFIIDLLVFDLNPILIRCCHKDHYQETLLATNEDVEIKQEIDDRFAIAALVELPWKLIPFVFGLFIIVQFMDEIGLVTILAQALVQISDDNTWIAMFVVGFMSTILCQCVNNQPMTVLLSFVLSRVPKENGGIEPDWYNAAYFALAIGANLGGNGTPTASLAVLMWQRILKKWNIHPKYVEIAKRGLSVTPLIVLACIVVVGIEIHLFPLK